MAIHIRTAEVIALVHDGPPRQGPATERRPRAPRAACSAGRGRSGVRAGSAARMVGPSSVMKLPPNRDLGGGAGGSPTSVVERTPTAILLARFGRSSEALPAPTVHERILAAVHRNGTRAKWRPLGAKAAPTRHLITHGAGAVRREMGSKSPIPSNERPGPRGDPSNVGEKGRRDRRQTPILREGSPRPRARNVRDSALSMSAAGRANAARRS